MWSSCLLLPRQLLNEANLRVQMQHQVMNNSPAIDILPALKGEAPWPKNVARRCSCKRQALCRR